MWCLLVFTRHQVTLVFLPTYSPELNPCENLFALVKRWMRLNAWQERFTDEIRRAFRSSIARQDVVNSYMKCLRVARGQDE